MSVKLKPLAWALSGLLTAPSVMAVDLVGVHDQAARNDPQLLAAEYRRMATGENERQAWANLLPSLSGEAALGRGDSETYRDGQLSSKSDTETSNWGLSLNQSLYRQRNYENLDIARGQISQAEAIYQLAYQEFLVRVTDAYFSVLTAEDGVTFAEAEEKALQRQFEQAEQRFEVGLTAVTDVHEARASYDRARARAIVSRNTRADTYESLRQLTGRSFSEVDPLQEELPLETPQPASAKEWIDIAMQSNPAVLSQRYAVEIAESNVRLQRSDHFPTLDAYATYRDFTDDSPGSELDGIFSADKFESESTSYGLRLNIPIYTGGVITSRTRQAQSLLDATMQDEEAQQRLTVRNIENAYRAVIAGIEQVQAFGQALISAEAALEATQAGFEVGTRTIVDVLISEQRYFQAQRDNSVARHTYILDHVRLKATAGLLEAQDLQTVNSLLQ